MRHLSVRAAALALCATALLAACEGEDDTVEPLPEGSFVLNASSQTAYTYFNLETQDTVAVASPGTSTDWDLAFRRFEVRLNGGVAGPKGVSGYNLQNNAGLTTAQFLALTPSNTTAAFDAIDEGDIPASGSFRTESLAEDFTGWFRPTPTGLVANRNAAWKFTLPGGRGHALLRVLAITNESTNPSPTDGMEAIRLGYRLQPVGGALGPEDSVTVTMPSGSSGVVNLQTKVVQLGVLPVTCDWDVRVSRAYEFQINEGATCGAGTFPLQPGQTFASQTSASDAPQYAPFIALVSGPIPNGFEDPRGPFLYGLNNDQLLYPTFNTYLVQVDDAVYKLQLTGYYNPLDPTQSGFPAIRFAQIR
ncbi:MAG: HmuY family protein [Gemmatimonadales bacterium]|jgi:hypothetical protein|nr:HmuY family protein [Gemmatimonadales bacterium]